MVMVLIYTSQILFKRLAYFPTLRFSAPPVSPVFVLCGHSACVGGAGHSWDWRADGA